MGLPDTYSCHPQPWDVSGAAVLAAVRFILSSGHYKAGPKPGASSGNPSFSTFPLFPPSPRHSGAPVPLAPLATSEPGGRQGSGRSGRGTPAIAGRGKPRAAQQGEATRRTYSAAAAGRAVGAVGAVGSGCAAAGGTGCGAPGQAGYKGRERRRRPGRAGSPGGWETPAAPPLPKWAQAKG